MNMKTVITKNELWQKDKDIIEFLLHEHFIHVTGLNTTYTNIDGLVKKNKIYADYNQYKKGIKGNYETNNNVTAVLTPGGFYFIKINAYKSIKKMPENLKEKLSHDSSLGVWCSNGDEIDFYPLMDRIKNPLSEEYGDPFFEV